MLRSNAHKEFLRKIDLKSAVIGTEHEVEGSIPN